MNWQSRIVRHDMEAPDQLLANPANWRRHPAKQREAVAGLLDRVGWVQDVIVNERTGFVVDGHLRIEEALSRGEPFVPVVYVDLSPEEEALVLASLDPLAGMAVTDEEALARLLGGVSAEGALAEMLTELGDIVPQTAFPALPNGGRSAFRQMTFTVTEAQEAMIDAALLLAKSEPFGDTGNENSNGNALARICEAYG